MHALWAHCGNTQPGWRTTGPCWCGYTPISHLQQQKLQNRSSRFSSSSISVGWRPPPARAASSQVGGLRGERLSVDTGASPDLLGEACDSIISRCVRHRPGTFTGPGGRETSLGSKCAEMKTTLVPHLQAAASVPPHDAIAHYGSC